MKSLMKMKNSLLKKAFLLHFHDNYFQNFCTDLISRTFLVPGIFRIIFANLASLREFARKLIGTKINMNKLINFDV